MKSLFQTAEQVLHQKSIYLKEEYICTLSLHVSFFPASDPDSRAVAVVVASTVGGVLIALLVLLVLLVLFIHRKQRQGFEPLMNARYNTTKYTESA